MMILRGKADNLSNLLYILCEKRFDANGSRCVSAPLLFTINLILKHIRCKGERSERADRLESRLNSILRATKEALKNDIAKIKALDKKTNPNSNVEPKGYRVGKVSLQQVSINKTNRKDWYSIHVD
ncbi:hypothetical protein [uncultured Helicobacter sp.]|uniref:hypothetical protein n=1 Tax=uncultured Helicobacter sp. TaxID=175537 RepID=UPI002620C11A|nr:hypothetical protein [uncultured Helicobacter sp.]